MNQTAPDPLELHALVAQTTYKPGWRFSLSTMERSDDGCAGLTLTIRTETRDSNPPHGITHVRHLFPVPPATYNRTSWQHWLFEQIRLVESHEAAEFFKVDGVRPYAPLHGPGWDPYLIAEIASADDARLTFRGEVKP
jgi:hypothetical protein